MPRHWVYRIGILLIFIAVFATPVSYLALGKVEMGEVVEITFENSGVTLMPNSLYPKIEFKHEGKTYYFLGDENENLLIGERVKVIFFKSNPSKAIIYTFGGIFLKSVIELPIGLLIWWALFQSYPNLFRPSDPLWSDNLLRPKKSKRRQIKISEMQIVAKALIYVMIAGVILSLFYGIWILYKEMASGQLPIRIGIAISVAIGLIIISIIHKVRKG